MGAISNACSELLAEGRGDAPLYANRLANHLPMALVALDRMGAAPVTLQGFAARYRRRLHPLVDEPGARDPRAGLGEGRHYAQFARFFDERIAEAGAEPVLREWVPRLLPGLAASAFHSMIRLAYAIDAGDRDETARALAYWATEYAPLPLSTETTAAAPGEIAARLAAVVDGYVFAPGIIIDKMLEIARHPGVATAAIQPRQELQLADLARFALDAYLGHEDFTLLHLVTGCHAFRLVLPYAGEPQPALRHLWQAVLAAWLTVPRAAGAGEGAGEAIDVESIAALACTSTDDHVVKLCYSALAEHRAYGDERYLRAASRKLRTAGLAPA